MVLSFDGCRSVSCRSNYLWFQNTNALFTWSTKSTILQLQAAAEFANLYNVYLRTSCLALFTVVCSLTVLFFLFLFVFLFFLCIARTCKGVMANKLIIITGYCLTKRWLKGQRSDHWRLVRREDGREGLGQIMAGYVNRWGQNIDPWPFQTATFNEKTGNKKSFESNIISTDFHNITMNDKISNFASFHP